MCLSGSELLAILFDARKWAADISYAFDTVLLRIFGYGFKNDRFALLGAVVSGAFSGVIWVLIVGSMRSVVVI